MSSQIFKLPIPTQILIDLLEVISVKTDNYFVVNNN
jgi:hypothetical protein